MKLAVLLKAGKAAEAEEIKAKVASLKEQAKDLENTMRVASERSEELLLTVPNIPHDSVPFGKGADDNEVFKSWDKPFPSLATGSMPTGNWRKSTIFSI